MFHGMYGYGWGWIIGIIFFIAVIWIIVRMVSQNNQLRGNNKTPLDILKERYAKGEIDKQEFEERKKDL
ncbi:MAG: SHOCT domain-containing protein [Candidatus Krumholzibacteriota bacterium]|nr:SHOCT domain-containing protein [Candidatus Krumholzibacteriota bacterium]